MNRSFFSNGNDSAASQRVALVACIAGLFFFYVLHDALQERAFRTEGFRFGWWMTLNELLVVSTLAYALELGAAPTTPKLETLRVLPTKGFFSRNSRKSEEEHPDSQRLRKLLFALSIALTVSQGAGSAALAFVTFPLKVAFKSSKLCPTMLFGVLLTGKRYSALDYCAALFLGASLATLSFADARYVGNDAKKLHELTIGCVLLTMAVCADALVPNLQEKVLKELRYPTARMIVWSNCASTALTFAYVAISGELAPAMQWSVKHPQGAMYLILQAFASYFGLRCYLLVVKTVSGVGGVVVTTFRKVVTIVLSYLLFAKPFTFTHLEAFGLLASGVALATYGKYKSSPDTTPGSPASGVVVQPKLTEKLLEKGPSSKVSPSGVETSSSGSAGGGPTGGPASAA